ncbi:hypothetical protein BGZ65_006445 [Modicella reniformis]|uniref:Uncharacterized protein n=1 Tax=Modicella reniformis TaxID=1440133 RepID=A0A9P6MBA2_9FUNG|nr:hypothetical protein BGZ65_006445 [Modicella reniformis]
MSDRELQEDSIKQYMDRHFDGPQVDMTKNETLQGQIIQEQIQTCKDLLKDPHRTKGNLIEKQQPTTELQRTMAEKRDHVLEPEHKVQHQQQSATNKLPKKQKEMPSLQKQPLNRLAAILSRVQAILTQTYELHEYPIPRLFIVLPKTTGLQNESTNPLSVQFRLYFLCECGSHTISEGSKISPEIHLAKHEGYDLEQPTEFFEKYGPYVLAMMHMIKYGIVTAGLVVLPLSNSRLLDGLGTAQEYPEYLKKNIARLVDNTINLLQDRRIDNEACADLALNHTEFDKIERLRDIVEANNGKYVEETGRIEINIGSNIMAKPFYDAMAEAHVVQELAITLKWNATMDDFQDLYNAVTKANIINLMVDGTHFKSPALNFTNRYRRFEPILQLASNTRVQSLQLKGFNFFSHISKSSLTSAPKLRVFSTDLKAKAKDKVLKVLNNFLEHCSSLVTLELRLDQKYSITMVSSDILCRLHKLESLRIGREGLCFSAGVSNGKIEDVDLTIEWLDGLSSDDLKFIKENHLKRLAIHRTPLCADKLSNLFLCTPVLSHLQIGYKDQRFLTAPVLGIGLQDLFKMTKSETLDKLELLSIDCAKLSLTAIVSQGRNQEMTMTFDRLNDLSSDDIEFIQRGDFTRLAITYAKRADGDRITGILRCNPVHSHVQIGHQQGRHLMIATTLNKLQDLVEMSTTETLDRDESFSIECRRLTLTASSSQGKARDMTMIIERLHDLTSDDLIFIQQGHFTQMAIETTPQESDVDRLADILRHSSALKILQIRAKKERGPAGTAAPELKFRDLVKMATVDSLINLESLSIDDVRLSLKATVLQGRIQEITMIFNDDLCFDAIEFIIVQCQFNRLAIKHTQNGAEDQLSAILRRSPVINHFHIKRQGEPYRTIATTADKELLELLELVKMATSGSLYKPGSFSINCERLTLTANFSQGEIQDMTITIEQLVDLTSDDLKFIHQGHIARLVIVIVDNPQWANSCRLTNMLRNNPEIKHIEIGCKEENQPSINGILKFQDLARMVTPSTHFKLESLKISCGRLFIDARFSKGMIQNMDMTIVRLSDLNTHYRSFIHKDHLSRLAIRCGPHMADENQLSDILRHSSRLRHLRIGYKPERFLAITNLVLSTREKVLEERGSSCLHTIKLMEENLTPFDVFGECSVYQTYIQSVLTFTEDSNSYHMRTWIRLRDGMCITDEDPVNDFVHQYGWSIVFFDEGLTCNNVFAAILDSIGPKVSQLETLRFNTFKLTFSEFDRLDKIVKRAPNFKELGLYIRIEWHSQLQMVQSLLDQYGSMLTLLHLHSTHLGAWVSRFAGFFPTRDSFPRLASFGLHFSHDLDFVSTCVSWTVSMISAPRRASVPRLLSIYFPQEAVESTHLELESTEPLRRISLTQAFLEPKDWRTLIEAVDLSELQHLDLWKSNFSEEHFKLLVERIPGDNIYKVPLRTLDIRSTSLAGSPDLSSMLAELREKAPSIVVLWD